VEGAQGSSQQDNSISDLLPSPLAAMLHPTREVIRSRSQESPSHVKPISSFPFFLCKPISSYLLTPFLEAPGPGERKNLEQQRGRILRCAWALDPHMTWVSCAPHGPWTHISMVWVWLALGCCRLECPSGVSFSMFEKVQYLSMWYFVLLGSMLSLFGTSVDFRSLLDVCLF